MGSNGVMNIVLIVMWFVLPLIPGFMLFRFLPMKDNDVSGPFKGFQIKLSGAFAAYFLIFLIAMPVINKLIVKEDDVYEIWTIHGTVVDKSSGAPINQFSNPIIRIRPLGEINNGEFKFKVIGTRVGETIEFQQMKVEADNYIPFNIEALDYSRGAPLQKNLWIPDLKLKTAELKEPIKLTALPNTETIKKPIYVQPE